MQKNSKSESDMSNNFLSKDKEFNTNFTPFYHKSSEDDDYFKQFFKFMKETMLDCTHISLKWSEDQI